MRALFAALAALLLAAGCAADPEGDALDVMEGEVQGLPPYDSMAHLKDAEMKTALFEVVKDHKGIGYDKARRTLFTKAPFLTAEGKVECLYSGRKVTPDGTMTVGGMNTEHTWPQSRGAEHEPMKSDLHHIFAVDAVANSARSKWEYGEVTCLDTEISECSYEKAGSALGKDDAGAWKFEVRKERRGDVARALFYFSVRYNKRINPREEATLRAWHDQDPVDTRERERNDAVQTIQSNRNPFVDRPDFVAKISDF